MARYASGRKAWGYSDRSGFRYRLRDMIKEWNGLKVGKDEYEAKHPQLEPSYPGPDPTALYEPRPDSRTEPAIERLLGVNPFLHSGSGVITVTEKNHGRSSSDTVRFRDAVGVGSQITKALLESSSGYSITATTTDQYTFTIPGISGSGESLTINHPYHGQGSSNKYAINGSTASSNVILTLIEGRTYRFDQANSSNSGHPIRIYEDANKSTQYNTGVTVNGTAGQAGAYTEITVPHGAPTLFYQCTNHALMGAQLNTTTNLTTYTVTVVGGNPSNHPYYNQGSTNKYAIGGSTATADVELNLVKGGLYRFDQSDSSNQNHPIRIYTDAAKNTQYTTGVTVVGTAGYAGAYTQIEVASDAPSTLFYMCTNHGYMGAQLSIGAAPATTTYTVTVVDGTVTSGDTSSLNIPFGGDIATVGPVTLEK